MPKGKNWFQIQEERAELDSKAPTGHTPVMSAALHDHTDVVTLLVFTQLWNR